MLSQDCQSVTGYNHISHIMDTLNLNADEGGGWDGGNNATKPGMDGKHNFNNWDILPDKGAL